MILRPETHRTMRRRAPLVGLIGLTLSLVACGADNKAEPTAPPSVATTTTTTAPAPDVAVLAAYRQSWADFLIAGKPMDPNNPALGAHMSGKQLDQVRVAFIAHKSNDEVIDGTIDLAPHVTSLNGDNAEVTDCLFDHTVLRKTTTQATVGKEDSTRQLIVATLQNQTDKGWVVIDINHKGEGCVPTP